MVGIIKNQQKEDESYLKNAGDWCFLHKVSKDEMRELERIASTPKLSLCEDSTSPDMFHVDSF
jgi:hypothetical protein